MPRLKTLNIESLFKTAVKVELNLDISQLFSPETTFLFQLIDGSWVHYALKYNELIKGDTLGKLLQKTYKISAEMFLDCYATPLTEAEKSLINEVFWLNDNYNLSTEMYKI